MVLWGYGGIGVGFGTAREAVALDIGYAISLCHSFFVILVKGNGLGYFFFYSGIFFMVLFSFLGSFLFSVSSFGIVCVDGDRGDVEEELWLGLLFVLSFS